MSTAIAPKDLQNTLTVNPFESSLVISRIEPLNNYSYSFFTFNDIAIADLNCLALSFSIIDNNFRMKFMETREFTILNNFRRVTKVTLHSLDAYGNLCASIDFDFYASSNLISIKDNVVEVEWQLRG